MGWRLIKWFVRAVVTLALAAAVAGVAGAWLFWRALPVTSGTEKLAGLSAEVRVWRDGYGVPHVFAANKDDAARALGWLHASERLFQMEVSRRVGQGRAAETFGPDLVKVDKFIRTLGFYPAAEASFAALSPEAQKRLQAYSDGVNAWLDARRGDLPPEFLLVGVTPEPWKPADSLVWGKLMALELSHNREQEALRAHIAQKLGPDEVGWFFPGARPGDPVTTQPTLTEKHASADDVDDAIGALTGLNRGASNEWVVAGSRTVTGKPILANDPHLGLGAPILWYLARIVTPDGWVKGGTVPGTPGVLLGQNDHIAWGFTTADTDVQDLFVETIDPTDPTRYLTPDGPKPFATRAETIKVKGGADVTLTIRTTRHGPVLSDVSADLASLAGPGTVVALAFTGLGDRDTTMEAVMRLDDARNWDDFLAALRLHQTPTQNIVYADTAGDIGFFSPGLVPVRKSGDGLAPVDGASGAFDWIGTVPFEELPQLHNPNSGFAFNANNANVADDHQPTFGRDWEETFRARRIQQFMDTIDKHSLDTSATMQGDRLSLAAKALQPFLARVAPSDERARQAQSLVANWDGVMDKDRAEPLIYTAFMGALHHILMEEKTGLDMQAKGPFAATTLIALMTDHPEWCGAPDKPDPDCKRTLGRALDEALALLVAREGADMSQWRWGNEHVSLLQHRVFSHVPLLDRMSDLSVPSSGGFYTLDRGGGFDAPKDRPFARTHGAGFRGLYDLADPEKSRFMITTGESGHILSPHYRDLVPLWNDGKSIVLTGSEDDLRKGGAKLLTLTP
ncbi:penicillin amidase [Roseiarcus fermentans]|uniref:Penicillin amidase n=1 Tax=Roseiarcus fermentans TaxID=1473586 RepID=A0A366EXM2_9HYPH|nr:penicillin acylase family protein [Roseiarcus fermentans]RBP06460.1 penicillin amidase [Roseiarcus fermentans]